MEAEKQAGLLCMQQYLDEIEYAADLKERDVDISCSDGESQKSSNIYIMRHGERVDFVFRNWIEGCFDEKGKYTQKDLNLPASLPDRQNGPMSYLLDTPITNVGMFQAKSMGGCFKEKEVNIDYVYCSPAFRCVQTCDAFLKGLGRKESLKIRIEPALFEWIHWIGDFPLLLTQSELIKAGFNIDTDYVPFTSKKELEENDETMEEHYKKGHAFVKKIIENHPNSNYLIVAHATALDTLSRILMNGKSLSPEELLEVCDHIPYCSLVNLNGEGHLWKFITPPCPPMSYGMNKKFHCKVLLDKY